MSMHTNKFEKPPKLPHLPEYQHGRGGRVPEDRHPHRPFAGERFPGVLG